MRLYSFIAICFVLHTINVKSQHMLLEVFNSGDSVSKLYVNTDDLYAGRWNELAQPNFWKKVITTSPDTCVINIAATREILGTISLSKWQRKDEAQKQLFRDSIRKECSLTLDDKIYVTTGKNHFYQIDKIMPSISRAIEIFNANRTDPWYAQAILLIECPGKLEYSTTGAYGAFQLMKSVARDNGLIVNEVIDERKDFDKSAYGAASLLRRICIPEAKRILDSQGICYEENELWFRLFVLHIYHAGAGNISGLITSMQPDKGGQELITTMWQSEWGGFKNASQNYTQVALASLMALQEKIYASCDYTYDCRLD